LAILVGCGEADDEASRPGDEDRDSRELAVVKWCHGDRSSDPEQAHPGS